MVDVTLDTLVSRGALSASDQLPVLPAGAGTLEKTTAGAVQNFVLTSVKQYGAAGDGVADDTTAIQAAINSGLAIWFPPGVYLISATLNLNTAASHGQILRGSGPTAVDGSGTGKTIIRPSAAVTTALLIDGTPFGGYVQGFGVEDLTVDMVNMADVAGSVGIKQAQAFGGRYSRVSIINDGVNKRGWKFQTGSYTTGLRDIQCANVEMTGTNGSNRVTTLTFDNADIKRVFATWTLNITFNGGTIQAPYNAATVVFLPIGTTPFGYLTNTTGLYLGLGLLTASNTLNLTFNGTDFENGGGYPATFNDGTHGSLTLIAGIQIPLTCTNTTFINGGPEGAYIQDNGLNTRMLGYQTVGTDICTARDYHMNDIPIAGNILGFTNFANFYANGSTQTFSINASTGLATFPNVTVQPVADAANILLIKTQAGLKVFNFSTGGGGILGVTNGSQITGYSDDFTTQTWNINAASGVLTLANSGSTKITLTPSNATVNVATGGGYFVNGANVVLGRRTGWTAPTGTVSRATFDQSSVTLPQLAQALGALIADLTTHGLIGP